MKKFLLLAAFMAPTAVVCGQGLIGFANNNATLVRTNGGGGVPVGDRFSIALYYNSSPDPSNVPGSFTITLGTPVHITNAPGRFNGGIRATPDTTQPGHPAWFQVKVWETAFGATFEEALMNAFILRTVDGVTRVAYLGTSNPFWLVTGHPSSAGVFPYHSPAFTGIEVALVPEPSVIVLGLLGMAGGLLLRCRRRIRT